MKSASFALKSKHKSRGAVKFAPKSKHKSIGTVTFRDDYLQFIVIGQLMEKREKRWSNKGIASPTYLQKLNSVSDPARAKGKREVLPPGYHL